MPKLLYASTKDSDMFYAVRVPIVDPFFYLDTGEKKYVFLDHREYGVFQEYQNKLDAQALGRDDKAACGNDTSLVLVNPLMESASRLRSSSFGAADARSDGKKTGSATSWLAYVILEKYGLLNEPIEVSNNLPLEMADFLRAQGVQLTVKNPFFPERLIKTSQEIQAIRDALVRTQHAYTHIEEVLRNSKIEGDTIVMNGEPLTSEMFKKEVEQILLSHDMSNDEGIIISCGPHAAIPHHRGTGLIRPHQTLVCDIFPRNRETGYFADMTRTYVKGTPSDEIKKMYAAVLEAQERAIEQVKPGVAMGDVHQGCVDMFVGKGYHVGDKGFTHGTGHGLGLDIHEFPSVRSKNTSVFELGHVVTIEPGLYYPDIGGVRIEDVVVVTDDGCQNLTEYHKEYIIE